MGFYKKTADEQLQKKNLSKADYLALAYLMTDEKNTLTN